MHIVINIENIQSMVYYNVMDTCYYQNRVILNIGHLHGDHKICLF
jgi:hypothetical protein